MQVWLAALQDVPPVGKIAESMMYSSSGAPALETFYDSFAGASKFVSGTIKGEPIKQAKGLVEALTATAAILGVQGAGLIGWAAKQSLRGKQDERTKRRGFL